MDSDLFARLGGDSDAAARDDARQFAHALELDSPVALFVALLGSAVFAAIRGSAFTSSWTSDEGR